MSDLDDALANVYGEHALALGWFRQHAGQTLPWSEIKENVNRGARLVNQAKGIYKPHYTDYALSVRQTLNSPYADKEVVFRRDGSWIYPYFQENDNPLERDKEATNRGLVECMRDRIPVGVLIQVKPKPGVEYKVLGLAAVVSWKDGYFLLEGYSRQEKLKKIEPGSDAAYDYARAISTPVLPEFDPRNNADYRERQIAEVVRRRGQARFRAALISAYGGACAITGNDAIEALEAAHISPYRGEHTNHPCNGLLLRADIHSLFDLGLIAIDAEKMVVVVAPQLMQTAYAELAGRQIRTPDNPAHAPAAEALEQHLEWSGLLLR